VKILYGIQSTGNGHISRSSKIISKLLQRGCSVDILLSGKNSQLPPMHPIKYNLSGLTLFYDGNGKISYWDTCKGLKIIEFFKDLKLNLQDYDLIISDFEPITAWAAKLQGRDCIGISNQCSYLSKKTPRPKKKDLLGEGILKWMAPISHPIGLHFESYDEFIFTPIIKESLINKGIKNLDLGYFTIYLPTYNIENILGHVYKIKSKKFEIFTGVKNPHHIGNCRILPLDRKNFDNSIRNCHGVITNGGFETSVESLYLGKNLMIIPTNGQYEQQCNAQALKGLGCFTGDLSNISEFIKNDNKIKIEWSDSSDKIVNLILSQTFLSKR
jgi:uncharacterized protein (TIGR00661 family)